MAKTILNVDPTVSCSLIDVKPAPESELSQIENQNFNFFQGDLTDQNFIKVTTKVFVEFTPFFNSDASHQQEQQKLGQRDKNFFFSHCSASTFFFNRNSSASRKKTKSLLKSKGH